MRWDSEHSTFNLHHVRPLYTPENLPEPSLRIKLKPCHFSKFLPMIKCCRAGPSFRSHSFLTSVRLVRFPAGHPIAHKISHQPINLKLGLESPAGTVPSLLMQGWSRYALLSAGDAVVWADLFFGERNATDLRRAIAAG